jgi:predicted nucleic acid-binding protein
VTIVVDASVALKWVLNEAGQDDAEALLDNDLIAPSLWLLEAANVLWRLCRRGEMSAEAAKARLAELYNAPVATEPLEDDLPAAADLANTLGHPVYDCLYLAMAIRENTYVVTADRRFHAAVEKSQSLKGRVRLLGDPT